MKDNDPKNRLFELANAHIENRLDDPQRDELEKLLQTDPAARRMFADILHDHATMYWNQVGASSGEIIEFPEAAVAPRSTGWWQSLAAAAAVAIMAIAWNLSHQGPAVFATMEQTRAARWESGALPTAEGARLAAGRLRLAEGLATVRFDSGAEVVLEAPAEIELIDGMNCVLLSGTAVADVPDSAIGFRIRTPSANVVDYGTRFAINVDRNTGATKTHVFEGMVEVEHPDSGKVVRLETGQGNFVAGDRMGLATTGPEEGEWAAGRSLLNRGSDWQVVSTSRDQYVYSKEIKDHMSDVLLLLKNTSDPNGPSRKTYLGFDISGVDRSRIAEAELILNFVPTGWGLASGVPDSKFSVYGVLPSELDEWTEAGMSWENAPANVAGDGGALVAGQVRKLGSFVLSQGVQHGRFGIRGAELAKFLGEDPNGFVTLVVVRDTEETKSGGLVHGIASHRHPALPAPRLALKVQ